MLVPADVCIKSTIRPGSVYLFLEDSFEGCDKKHYVIVLNSNPLSDELLFLVWSKTLSEKVFLHIDSASLPIETFVDITGKCDWLAHPTVVDCNNVIEKDINELIGELESGELKMIGTVSEEILSSLISGVLISPLVDRRIQKIIKA